MNQNVCVNLSVTQTENTSMKMSTSINVSISSTVNSSVCMSVNITVSEYELECEYKLNVCIARTELAK